MDEEQHHANSPTGFADLAAEFHDKRYRDAYVASHTRAVLARQMRNFRGKISQAEFASEIGKQKTVIARLENPAYGGWSIRTMLEVARKSNVAVFARFVDFPTFLKLSRDMSEIALRPKAYDQSAVDEAAREDRLTSTDDALKAMFSKPPEQNVDAPAKLGALPPGNDNDRTAVPAVASG